MRPLVLALLLLVVAQPALAAPTPGDRLPSFALSSSAGGTRAAWKPGQITVITFCAFWCDTWKEQSRRLTLSRQALSGLPVAWTMISVDGRWADKGARSPQDGWGDAARDALLDAGGSWTHRLAVHSVPTTLVVDKDGIVRHAEQGITRSQTLLRVVRALLASPASQAERSGAAPVRLVFDDFPSRDPRLDDRLLDALRAANVRATFCGDAARRRLSPAIVQRAKAEGHLLRAPFGTPGRGVVDPFDWKRPGTEELCRRVLCAVAPGKTVLLHAGVLETVNALPSLLQSLHNRGLLDFQP